MFYEEDHIIGEVVIGIFRYILELQEMHKEVLLLLNILHILLVEKTQRESMN